MKKPYTLEKLCDELGKFNAIYQYMVINWIDINNLTPSQEISKSVYKRSKREWKEVKWVPGGGKWGKWCIKNKKKRKYQKY